VNLRINLPILGLIIHASASAAVSPWYGFYGGTSRDGAYSLQQTADRGLIIFGYTYSFGVGSADAMLIRTDSLGNHVWVKTFGGPNPDFGKYVRQVSGGGYVILGETFLSGNFDLFLARTDTGGNIIWAKTFGGSNNEYASSVQQTGSGGFVVISNTQSFGAGQTDVLLIKTDGNGNLQWAKTYGGTLDDSARAIVQTSDGGYIITGTTNSFGTGTYDIFLIKTDSSGNLLWARVYDGPADDVASSVIETMGKDIVVAGHSRSFGAGLHDFLLLKTDSLGNLQWVKTYGGSNEDWAYSVYEAYDHGYIIAGSTESFGAGLKDFLMIKTNLDGILQWAKTYGGTNEDEPFQVQQTSDTGFVLAGYTQSFGAGLLDFMVVKTDTGGNVSTCPVGNPIPTEISQYMVVSAISPIITSLSLGSNVSPGITNPTIITGGCPTTSISEGCFSNNSTISLGKGYITVTQPGEFEVKIYDIKGKVVKRVGASNSVKIHLQSGIYFVEVLTEKAKVINKVIISHSAL